jgi:hypothetical protein
MAEGALGASKAEQVADAVNKGLQNLIVNCTRAEGVRNYLHLGVIGYGGTVGSVLPSLGSSVLHSLSQVVEHPLRIENRRRKVPDGAGGFYEESIVFPVWVEPSAYGQTPMCAALDLAFQELQTWIRDHPKARPPVVLNFTDGQATDGDPIPYADRLRDLRTEDGNVTLMNLHFAPDALQKIIYPDSTAGISDPYAEQLFQMSSILTPDMQIQAKAWGCPVTPLSHGYVLNADVPDLVTFIELGTLSESFSRLS